MPLSAAEGIEPKQQLHRQHPLSRVKFDGNCRLFLCFDNAWLFTLFTTCWQLLWRRLRQSKPVQARMKISGMRAAVLCWNASPRDGRLSCLAHAACVSGRLSWILKLQLMLSHSSYRGSAPTTLHRNGYFQHRETAVTSKPVALRGAEAIGVGCSHESRSYQRPWWVTAERSTTSTCDK